jgi:hypothetical protein
MLRKVLTGLALCVSALGVAPLALGSGIPVVDALLNSTAAAQLHQDHDGHPIWREIGIEEPQPAPAFLEALSALVGRWLIARSSEPEMDVVTVMCRARGYIERRGAEQSLGIAWRR